MRTIILAGMTAFALAAMPAIAQDTETGASAATPQTADSGPPEQETADEANAEALPPAPTTVTSGAGAEVTSYPGNLAPPPASALNRDYPVCGGAIQDECQNPGEGGAPGRSRALSYWPGKPASEGGR